MRTLYLCQIYLGINCLKLDRKTTASLLLCVAVKNIKLHNYLDTFSTGLYRVNYDEKNWNMLQESLMNEESFKNINPMNRAQLIADSLSLAWNGHLDYNAVFSFIGYLKHESEHIPWKTALSGLGSVNQMLLRTPAFGYFKVYLCS